MRYISFTLAALVTAQLATADEPPTIGSKPPEQEKPAASLTLCDPAPALNVTKWLQGEAVRKFDPGKIYVVDFWATWCGACIRSMPHLAELQDRYKDRGVTIIGFTSRDIRENSNSEEQVTAF